MTPRPTSWDFASRTLRNLSSSRMVSSHNGLDTERKWERGEGLLDLHSDGLRGRGLLLLRESDLHSAVLHRRDGLLRHDLFGQRETPVEGAVVPLAEDVRLVLRCLLTARLRADLQAVRRRSDLHVVLRYPTDLRCDEEFDALVLHVDRRLPHGLAVA